MFYYINLVVTTNGLESTQVSRICTFVGWMERAVSAGSATVATAGDRGEEQQESEPMSVFSSDMARLRKSRYHDVRRQQDAKWNVASGLMGVAYPVRASSVAEWKKLTKKEAGSGNINGGTRFLRKCVKHIGMKNIAW